jgi:hypothetical protein
MNKLRFGLKKLSKSLNNSQHVSRKKEGVCSGCGGVGHFRCDIKCPVTAKICCQSAGRRREYKGKKSQAGHWIWERTSKW